jgi:hypothetical protein
MAFKNDVDRPSHDENHPGICLQAGENASLDVQAGSTGTVDVIGQATFSVLAGFIL